MRLYALMSALLVALLALSACAADEPADTAGAATTPTPADTARPATTSTPAGGHGGHGMAAGDADLADLRFILEMIAHHQGAIDMAEIARTRAERAEIRALAEAIITAQQAEIARMREWHRAWFDGEVPEGGHGFASHEMGMEMDLSALEAADPFDRAFIEAMIPHHEGAIHMAEMVLQTTEREEIRALAEEIVEVQRAEIAEMREWRRAWFGE